MVGREGALAAPDRDLTALTAQRLRERGAARVALVRPADLDADVRAAGRWGGGRLASSRTHFASSCCIVGWTHPSRSLQDPLDSLKASLLAQWTARRPPSEAPDLPWLAVVPQADALGPSLLTALAVWWDRIVRAAHGRAMGLVLAMGSSGPWLLRE